MDRKNYFSGAPMELVDGYSRMVQAGPFLYCGGTTSVQPDGSVAYENDSYGQVRYVLEKLIKIVEQAGGTREDVYSVKIYATSEFDEKEGLQAYTELFSKVKPLLTCVTIHQLTRPAQLVEIEMNAVRGSSRAEEWEGISLARTNYNADNSFADEIGFSQMVRIGPFVYIGGTNSVQSNGIAVGDDNTEQSDYVYKKQFEMLEQAGASADDIVKIKKYVRKEYMDSFDMTRTSVHDKWDEIVYSEVIADKFVNEGQLLETEIFAIIGCGGHRRLDSWGTIDFCKDVKGELGKFAEYVKVGPFLYGGLHHCLDELGTVVGIGDSERQESYLVSKFTEDIKEFGFVPEEMVKFKAYYTKDFGRLYGESEVPAYEKIYKPVKPLYTGVYVSLTGKEEEIFEMEMLAVKGAVEKSGC